MLARRVISRPATALLRSRYQTLRHLFGTSVPKPPIYPPRSLGLLAKVRFRSDGKPRSLLMGGLGAAFGERFFSILLSFDMIRTYREIAAWDKVAAMLTDLASVIHTDKGYDSVDFENAEATLAYFEKLLHSDWGRFTKEVIELIGEDATSAPAHIIMRTAANNVHNRIKDFSSKPPIDISRDILDAVPKLLALLRPTSHNTSQDIVRSNTDPPNDTAADSESYTPCE
ncbi:hypothetical protein CPB84DRAFT_1965147 [Gymnopilus junonius]|uniref:Uncharacterized protein n=1 Tax=Gymnopilus junonius TaxID=109634 RepID=A0A9P5NHB5_GYMJU|nr:hypothetical protein CPB84DRAFT_1965147 [Gymnopilus junonius]